MKVEDGDGFTCSEADFMPAPPMAPAALIVQAEAMAFDLSDGYGDHRDHAADMILRLVAEIQRLRDAV